MLVSVNACAVYKPEPQSAKNNAHLSKLVLYICIMSAGFFSVLYRVAHTIIRYRHLVRNSLPVFRIIQFTRANTEAADASTCQMKHTQHFLIAAIQRIMNAFEYRQTPV